jgi:hypothetical protein
MEEVLMEFSAVMPIKAGVPTVNGRVYSQEVFDKMVAAAQTYIDCNRALVFTSADSVSGNLDRAAGIVERQRVDDGQWVVEGRWLRVPEYERARAMLGSNPRITPAVSGVVAERDGVCYVEDVTWHYFSVHPGDFDEGPLHG